MGAEHSRLPPWRDRLHCRLSQAMKRFEIMFHHVITCSILNNPKAADASKASQIQRFQLLMSLAAGLAVSLLLPSFELFLNCAELLIDASEQSGTQSRSVYPSDFEDVRYWRPVSRRLQMRNCTLSLRMTCIQHWNMIEQLQYRTVAPSPYIRLRRVKDSKRM